MSGFNSPKNYDDVFWRDTLLGLCHTLQDKISWTNVFDSGEKIVKVPFLYSLTGDERFLLDAFVDDYAGTRLEGDYQPVPRAVVVQTGFTQKTAELTNSNVRLLTYVEDDEGNTRKVYGKYRIVPLKFTYDITIILSSEIDTMKCAQSIVDNFLPVTPFFFDYKNIRMEALMVSPETQTVEIIRDISSTTESNKTMKYSLDVHVNYPIPSKDKPVDYNNRIRIKGNIKTLGDLGNHPRKFLGTDAQGETSKRPRPGKL